MIYVLESPFAMLGVLILVAEMKLESFQAHLYSN